MICVIGFVNWKIFCEFYDRYIIYSRMNETYVCFIPKDGKPTKVKDFRQDYCENSGW